MTELPPDAVTLARTEMEPLLGHLCALLGDEGQDRQEAFFSGILRGIRGCADEADLAGPFMELSTSAFQGFVYSPAAALLVDRLLETAQRIAMTLSAADELPH